MSEFNNEFFTDIMESIEHLEQSLLDYDEALSKNENNPAQIHIIFRNAHNLKGILALAQFENSQNLIHIIEDNFDSIRNGKSVMSQDLIDKSLKSLDLISTSMSEGKENPNDFIELKQALEPSMGIAEINPILPFELYSHEKEKTIQKCNGNSAFFLIEKLIKSNIDKETYSNLPIFQDVQEIGTLIGFRPEWEKLNKKSDDDLLRIFFTTDKKEDDLFFIIFDPLKPLDKSKICTFLSKSIDRDNAKKVIEIDQEVNYSIPENLNILLVEDDFITRTLESKILSQFGTCNVVVNGKEAITAFRNSLREKKYYDLILLDIMLPEIDGEGVLAKIRALETGNGISGLDRVKIIMVSSINSIETIKHSFSEQSDAYIIKPFTEKKLLRELRHIPFK